MKARALRRVLLAAALLAPGAPSWATAPGALFEQGNDAYEGGRFEEAAQAYARIVEYGVRDPRVHYNLGNAYFKLGRLGPAILQYERALRLAPADRDIRDNLDFARTRIRDRVEEPESPYPVKALREFLEPVSPDTPAVIALGFYWLAAASFGALCLTGGGAARRALGYAGSTAVLCALLAGAALGWKIHMLETTHAVVMEDRADVLSGPATDNTILFTVHEGTRLEVRSRRDGWLQVSLPNALSGWIAASTVEAV